LQGVGRQTESTLMCRLHAESFEPRQPDAKQGMLQTKYTGSRTIGIREQLGRKKNRRDRSGNAPAATVLQCARNSKAHMCSRWHPKEAKRWQFYTAYLLSSKISPEGEWIEVVRIDKEEPV